MEDIVKYESNNGYTGILKKGLSLTILDCDGKRILHSACSNVHSYGELISVVDGITAFLDIINSAVENGVDLGNE